MTEIEKKAEEYATNNCNEYYGYENYKTEYFKFGDCPYECLVRWEASKEAYKDGYEQGQKDNCENHKDCQFLKYFEKENEELKKAVTEKNSVVEKMKCCQNCKYYDATGLDNIQCSACFNGIDKWGLAE